MFAEGLGAEGRLEVEHGRLGVDGGVVGVQVRERVEISSVVILIFSREEFGHHGLSGVAVDMFAEGLGAGGLLHVERELLGVGGEVVGVQVRA